MGLSPIAGVREVDKVRTKADRGVAPPFALDRSGRIEEDAYSQHSEGAERGLEEAAEQTDEANESAETTPPDQDNTVDFVA